MNTWQKQWMVALAIFVGSVASMSCAGELTKKDSPKTSDLAEKIARFAPTQITADVSHFSAKDRQALDQLIVAGQLMDEIFLRQVWSGNVALLEKLKADASPEGQLKLLYFRINFGPWSRLDENKPFIEGVSEKKLPGANYYPEDMTKQEFEEWVKTLSPADQEKAKGFFYVIRRDAHGKLKLVSYSEEYRSWLEPAAQALREAAALTENQSLKNYLIKRASAFMSNDYYVSDVAWMELNAPIDVTIGPYETYEDELFGYKAAFEAFITLRDDAETAKLTKFSRYLQELENHLPIEARYRNPKLGAASPIRVVDEVFAGGDTKAGVQTAAFNLPNDERVIKEKGSKRVMLKNVQEAKFNQVLSPISRVALGSEQQSEISFDAFFTHILAHELMHGLGPHNIRVGGRATTVRKELQELYSAIEEAKADITGLWALQYLIDKGVVEKSLERPLYITFLASAFRSVRFGINEAHGKGVAVQFNYLIDEEAIQYQEPSGTFSVNFDKVREGVRKLTHDILTLQAEGSKEKAKALLDKYGVIRPEMKKTLDQLSGVPVDIEPKFPLAK
jgi:hypothetical protein